MENINNQFSTPTFNNGLSYDNNNWKLTKHSSNEVNNDRFIIDNRNINSKDIHISKYTSDIINPIRRNELKQVLSIDSLFRDNNETSDSGDFIFTFQEPMKNVVSMKLCSLELPNIWYSFSSKRRNNEFTITFKNVNDGSGYFYNKTYKIIIPDGNYTVGEFELMMNNMFHNLDPNKALDFIRLNVSNITGKVIIRANDISDPDLGTSPIPYEPTNAYYSPNFYFEIDFVLDDMPERELYKNAGWMMGFKNEFYSISNINTFIDYTTYSTNAITYRNYLLSEGIYGSSINTYVFLVLDDFNNNFKDSIYSGKDKEYIHDNIIARIPIISGSNTLLFNNPGDLIFRQRDYFGPVKIDKLKVQLIDRYGEVIDLNRNNFSFSLEFTQLYT
jgi:hypothetical protein